MEGGGGKCGVVETVGRKWRVGSMVWWRRWGGCGEWRGKVGRSVERRSDEGRKYGLVREVESCSQRCSYAILSPTYSFVQFLLSESLGCHKPPPESFCKLILPSQVTMCACVMV